MSLAIQLLGRPRIDGPTGETYQFRSRKSWAVLAFILRSERPPTRSQLASLLFAEADDPLRALRWSLAEIRRSLGDGGSIEGDPLTLRLPAGSSVDVDVVLRGTWVDAVGVDGLGAELLGDLTIPSAPAFSSWLLAEQRHVAASAEAVLHEAALGSMAGGDEQLAIGYAVRAAVMSPLDENHQALLIRLYRLTGDDVGAERQFAACVALFENELGSAPGAAVQAAMRETRIQRVTVDDPVSVAAIVEAGSAAVASGAIEAGVRSLRTAVRLADGADDIDLRINSRLVLAEALVHSRHGLDEEGVAALFEVTDIALARGDRAAVARARAELGYVDFLRGRYERAELWLTEAMDFADGSPQICAKATTYLGSVESDRANYPGAVDLLERAIALSRVAVDPRRQALGLAMLGRVSLLREDFDAGARQLDDSIRLAESDHWLAFLPWPQALRGQVQLARDDSAGAEELLRQAFARACQLGDPCWEGMAARGLAMLADTTGETSLAFELLADARVRCNRLADPYVWLDAYILDAQCNLGVRHDHPDTERWVDAMRTLTSRTAMRELAVRSMLYGAALGHDGDGAAAVVHGADIANPALQQLLEA